MLKNDGRFGESENRIQLISNTGVMGKTFFNEVVKIKCGHRIFILATTLTSRRASRKGHPASPTGDPYESRTNRRQ
jgi:hypothetical protein